MALQSYRVLFIIVVLLAAFFAAYPALEKVQVHPSDQSVPFSEFWLLGSNQTAQDYPYNITADENYTVYLGVANQLGSCAYYQVEVKFCNLTQQAPGEFNDTPSSQPSLYNMSLFVPDSQSLQKPITFSFDYAYNSNASLVDFNYLTFDGLPLSLQGYSTTWNATRSAYCGNLFFELWIYNSTTGAFQYHDRYVNLQLNVTT